MAEQIVSRFRANQCIMFFIKKGILEWRAQRAMRNDE
jgi:hypothetical protein